MRDHQYQTIKFQYIIQQMNLQRLLSSEQIYKKQFPKFLEVLQSDPQLETLLRNVVLFCKQVFSSNLNQRKKYLCLLLVRDIFENVKLQYYEKLIDESLGGKVLAMVQAMLEGKIGVGLTEERDKDYADKLINLAIETIVFWGKRLGYMEKSVFVHAFEEISKMKVQMPKEFIYYNKEMIVELWKDSKDSMPTNPLLQSLSQKFHNYKSTLQSLINTSILLQSQLPLPPILQPLREYLLSFFTSYRQLQPLETSERDIIIVQFHILNSLYKRLCPLLSISVQDLINTIREVFGVIYPSEYDSVDRLDVVDLVGVWRFNALAVFERIRGRIQMEEKELGEFKLAIDIEKEDKMGPLPQQLSYSKSSSQKKFSRSAQN